MSDYVIESPEAEQIEKASLPVVVAARAMTVVDAPTHGLALMQMKNLKGAEKKVHERLDPLVAAANIAHKGLTKLLADLLRPLKDASAILEGRCQEYERVERERALAETQRLMADARQREEERQILDAISADESGDKATAAAILEEQRALPVIVVAPALAKVSGVSTRTDWRAEVVDKLALIRYVAAHPEWTNLLEANEPALSGLARSQRSALAIPGVRAIEVQGRSVRA